MKKDEWEDVEGEESNAGSEEEEEDTTLNNSDVVMKYKKAAVYCNEVLQQVITECVVGANAAAIGKKADTEIMLKVRQTFRGVEKGIAFPTCLSVNSCVCHNAPGEADDPHGAAEVLAPFDIVHIELGVHIDGYCTIAMHTLMVLPPGETAIPPERQSAVNVITAAYHAMNLAMRLFQPKQCVYDVTSCFEHVAELYGVNCVEGTLSHQLKRYIIDGSKCIVGKNVAEHKVHNYAFEEATVWSLDAVFSTGKGKLKEREAKTSVYKGALESDYKAKLAAGAEVKGEIDSRFQTFPFAVRNLEHKKARLGLNEMTKHGCIVPYPVLYEKDGEVVARFGCTILVTNQKIERVTGLPPQPFAQAQKPIDADPLLVEASKLPLQFAGKKVRKAKQGAAVPPLEEVKK